MIYVCVLFQWFCRVFQHAGCWLEHITFGNFKDWHGLCAKGLSEMCREHHIAPWINSGWAMSSSRNLRPEPSKVGSCFSDFNCFNCRCDLIFDRGELERNGVNVLIVETYVYIYIYLSRINSALITSIFLKRLGRTTASKACRSTVTRPWTAGQGNPAMAAKYIGEHMPRYVRGKAAYKELLIHHMANIQKFQFSWTMKIPFIKNLKEFLGLIQNSFRFFAIKQNLFRLFGILFSNMFWWKGAESVVKQFGFLPRWRCPGEFHTERALQKMMKLTIDRYLKHLHLVKCQNLVDVKLPRIFLDMTTPFSSLSLDVKNNIYTDFERCRRRERFKCP